MFYSFFLNFIYTVNSSNSDQGFTENQFMLHDIRKETTEKIFILTFKIVYLKNSQAFGFLRWINNNIV